MVQETETRVSDLSAQAAEDLPEAVSAVPGILIEFTPKLPSTESIDLPSFIIQDLGAVDEPAPFHPAIKIPKTSRPPLMS